MIIHDVQFARVDADIIDKLIEKEESSVSKLSDKEQEKLQKMIEEQVSKEKFTVQVQNHVSFRFSCCNYTK